MAKVFISYRRSDSADATGRLTDRLIAQFGRENVFKDVDSIPLGRDFRTVLDHAVTSCDVFLVVIGPRWISVSDDTGNPRLHEASDFVRIEIETALQRDIPVIPIVLGDTSMPKPEQLPDSLSDLVFRNASRIRPDPDFHNDVDRAIAAITKATANWPEREAPHAKTLVPNSNATNGDRNNRNEPSDQEQKKRIIGEILASVVQAKTAEVTKHAPKSQADSHSKEPFVIPYRSVAMQRVNARRMGKNTDKQIDSELRFFFTFAIVMLLILFGTLMCFAYTWWTH